MKEKVYLLFEEKNWDCEEYCDVIRVFRNKEDAIKALKEYRDAFIEEHKDEWEDAKKNPYYWTIQDRPEYFQLLDESMGENYELVVSEREIE